MPSRASSTAPARMADGAGRNSNAIVPERTAASHADNTKAKTESPGQLTLAAVRRLSMTDRPVQPVSIAQKLRQRARPYLIARARKLDGDHFVDATGTAIEHRDTIAEIDRLLDIVGDKD